MSSVLVFARLERKPFRPAAGQKCCFSERLSADVLTVDVLVLGGTIRCEERVYKATGSMDEKPAAQIRRAADQAKDLLGQLGPLVWALHVVRQPAGAFAVCVDREPGKYVEIRTSETEIERGQRKQRVVGILHALRLLRSGGDADLLESAGYRAMVNRSIVVYAVAVLEEFLDRVAEVLGHRDDHWPADTLCKLEHLRKEHCIDLRGVNSYIGTGWLVLVRNAVIHNDGSAPADVARDAGQYGLKSRWGLGKDGEGRDVLVWDTENRLSRRCLAGKRFSLSIDDFVLPRLRDAQAFVAAAQKVLEDAARRRTGDPAPSG